VCLSKDKQVNPTYLIIYLPIIVWGWVATKYSDFWEEKLQCTMRMIKIDAEWVTITENYPKWSKLIKNRLFFSNGVGRIGWNDTKWSKMILNDPKWSKMIQNDPKWSSII